MAARSWTVPLPFRCPYLNLNQTLHKAVKSKRIAEIRDTAQREAEALGIPTLERFTACLHYVPPSSARRDPENLVPTSKAAVDGLVLAGVAVDDAPAYFTPQVPVIDPPVTPRAAGPDLLRFYVEVTEITDEPDHACPVPGCDHAEENRP